MGKVKSAMEIALERSSKLAAATDKSQAWEEQQFRLVGEELARRFLGTEINVPDLKLQLERYQGTARETVARVAATAMIRQLSFDNYTRVLAGIAALRHDEAADRWIEEARRGCEQFQDERARERERVSGLWARRQREELARRGIAGTAIAGFNFEMSSEWRQINELWEGRLATIRQGLEAFLAGGSD